MHGVGQGESQKTKLCFQNTRFMAEAAFLRCGEGGAFHESVLRELASPLGKRGFPGGSEGKESACNAGDPGSVPGLGRSPGEGSAHPLQCSCLENSMDRGAWRAVGNGITKSWTRPSD